MVEVGVFMETSLKNIKCLKCSKNVFLNEFCRQHFIENVEKRVKKEIRENANLKKGDVLFVNNNNSKILEYFIKNVIKTPVEITRDKKSKYNKEIVLWTMDDEIALFLHQLFNNKKIIGVGQDKKRIKLFRTIKDNELIEYAKIKKLHFKRKKGKNENEILKEVYEIEKRHKETMNSILRCIEKISKIIQ
ncbi:MAG: hypothetical protein N3D84_00990 [Candidatus Woesearchaeota archaeon]|nr:hypothetical protein [Candidatus Woesearchaeota archaeon]